MVYWRRPGDRGRYPLHMPMNTLALQSAIRQARQCSYWDFIIDGRRLAEVLRIGDFIPPIGWLQPKVETHFLSMLLRKSPSDLHGERVPLYVCPECADYGCGVVSCAIERTTDGIVWRDFGMQNNHDDEIRIEDRDRWRSYVFDPTEYFGALSGHYDLARNGG